MGAERVEMAPADQAFILAPPGGSLVLGPGDDAGGAMAADGEIGDRLGLGRGQDQLAAKLLALIIGGGRAGADVDQLGLGAAADAVLGEADRLLRPGGYPHLVAPAIAVPPLLPQLREAGVPGGARALGAVEGLAVRRQADHLDLGEAVGGEPVADQLGGGAIAFRDPHPVVERQDLDRAKRLASGDFGADRPRLVARKQGRVVLALAVRRHRRRQHQAEDE